MQVTLLFAGKLTGVKRHRVTKKNSQQSIFRVAELCNCSVSTVSNVLNNKGRFSEATRQAVLQAVAKLNYQPQSAGRSLRLRKTETLGLLFYPSCAEIFRNPFYSEVMEGIETALLKSGYHLLLAGYDTTSNGSKTPPKFLQQGKVDGLILLGRFPSEIIQRFCKFGTPLVLLDSSAEWPVDSVVCDGFSAEVDVVAQLHALGHRRIVMLAYSHEDSNIDQRIQGFLSGMKALGCADGRSSVIRDFMRHDDIYAALRKRLDDAEPPTAVIAVNDTLALDIMARLQADGLRVPDKVSVVGFDDDTASATSSPALSTVRVDRERLGRLGVELIMNRLKDPAAPVVRSLLPAEVVFRQSVAAALP